MPKPDKLRKLSLRVAPSLGPSLLSTFPHFQEFFLKFILHSNHYVFSSQVFIRLIIFAFLTIFYQLLAVSVDKLLTLVDTLKENPIGSLCSSLVCCIFTLL